MFRGAKIGYLKHFHDFTFVQKGLIVMTSIYIPILWIKTFHGWSFICEKHGSYIVVETF